MRSLWLLAEKYLRERAYKYIEMPSYVECKGQAHLDEIYETVIDNGGKGVILRNPSAAYRSGTTKDFLKYLVRVLPTRVVLSS